MEGSRMLPSHLAPNRPDDQPEERVRRQTLFLEKLRRDGAYACEIRAAERMLRIFRAELASSEARAGRYPSFTGAVAESSVSIGSHSMAACWTGLPATRMSSVMTSRPPSRR